MIVYRALYFTPYCNTTQPYMRQKMSHALPGRAMRVTCESHLEHGRSARAVMVATVPGRDTGASVLAHVLKSFPGYHLQGYTMGNGWMHLSNFAHSWLSMQYKMTDPSNAHYIHFSQFIASALDNIGPSHTSHFRAFPELLRRGIKPAWYQLYNMTLVMCQLRQLIMEAYNPEGHGAFGFIQAFDVNSRKDAEEGLATRAYTVADALRSIDLFMQLFPQGKVILHLPVATVPDPAHGIPPCACTGAFPRCRHSFDSAWPDHRLHMMSQLVRYHRNQPVRTLLTSASRDFRNMSRFTMKLARFLREERPPSLRRVAAKAFGWWRSKAIQDKVLGLAPVPVANRAYSRDDLCLRVGAVNSPSIDRAGLWRCPSVRCTRATGVPLPAAPDSCAACSATLADWAWRDAWRAS